VSTTRGKLTETWLPTKVIIADFVDGELVTDLGEGIEDQAGRLEVLVRRSGRSVGMVSLNVADDGGSLTERLQAAAETLPSPAEAPWTKVEPPTWPKVVVAIPTVFGRLEMLRLAVASLGRLDYPEFDIVLVDNRPTPKEEEYAYVRSATDRPVHILHEPERGISAARNRSLLDCDAPFIAFTDDDVQVDRGWLREIIRPFLVDLNVACVSGLVIPSELTSPEQSQFEHFFGGLHRSFEPVLHSGDRPSESDPLFPYAAGRFGAGNNMAFRVSTLKGFGGFDTSLGTGTLARGGEDLAAFIKILLGGDAIAIEPSAVVHHSHRATSDAFRYQVFSYGVGLAAMYTALMLEDGRHRRGIVARLPRAIRLFVGSGNGTVKRGSSDASVPASLRLRQAAGIVVGPFLYLRSRRQHPQTPTVPTGSGTSKVRQAIHRA
jgi:glycosyltransferase involved in cell wall biosynthesis